MKNSYQFSHGDTPLRGTASTPYEALLRAVRLAGETGRPVTILASGLVTRIVEPGYVPTWAETPADQRRGEPIPIGSRVKVGPDAVNPEDQARAGKIGTLLGFSRGRGLAEVEFPSGIAWVATEALTT